MVKVSLPEVKRFMTECLLAAGAKSYPARQQANLLIYADKMGHHDQGLNKLYLYVHYIKKGRCRPNNKPVLLKEAPSTAWIDVKNVMAATAGNFAMERAIKTAQKTGVGCVVATGCCHDVEPLCYWVKKAKNRGFIGMAYSTPPSAVSGQNDEPLKLLGDGKTLLPVKKCFVYGNQNIEETNLPSPINSIIKCEHKKRRFENLQAFFKLFPGNKRLHNWIRVPLARKCLHSFVAVNPACFAFGINNRFSNLDAIWKEWDEIDPKLPELLENHAATETFAFEDQTLDYQTQQINDSIVLAYKLGVKAMKLQEE